ncbi:MAG: class I SAM-dependent methyltransferase [Terriglobia bacterium]
MDSTTGSDLEEFKVQDAASYNAVAEHFDRFTSIVTKPLALTTIRLARLKSNGRLADIGTGSGIVAIQAAGSPAAPRVTGIDLSDGLLQAAQRNAREAGVASRLQLVKADAEALPLHDESCDAVISLFALLHFPHPERALAEMKRILRPGGRLVIGIGAPPPWDTLQAWLHRAGRVRDLVQLKTGKLLLAPAHLNAIVAECIPAAGHAEETEMARHRSARTGSAVSLIRQLNLAEVETSWEGHQLALDDADEFWDLQSTFSSFARKRLEAATEAQTRMVRARFNDDCSRVLKRGGKLVYHYAAYYIAATRA